LKKIGILTYHHVANWGSVLQTVCLYKFLNKIYPNAKIEVIDYVTETSNNYNTSNLYSKKRKFNISFKVRNNNFYNRWRKCNEFLSRHIELSPEKLLSDNIDLGKSFIERQNYDLVFVGSDTVFQIGPYAGNRYIGAPQAPNLYFLPFPSKFRKIAFAASVDPFHPRHLENADTEGLRNSLDDFNSIFFRDEVTCKVLERLNVKPDRMSYMPDPSLLVDFDLFCDIDCVKMNGNNLVGVAVGNPQLTAKIIRTLKSMKYQPVDLMGGKTSEGVITTENVNSVEQFMAIHKQLKLVITDRFHGSIKTLVLGDCPVIGIEESKKYPLENSKLRDLYKRLGIEDMLIRYNDEEVESDWIKSKLEKWRWNKLEILSAVQKLRSDASEVLRKHDVL
jgi:hypothetical protein